MESTIFDTRAASGVIGMLSGCASGPPGLPVPKSAGMVEEIMLDQQLTKAFQAGLRHSRHVRFVKKNVDGTHVSVDGRC